MHPAYRKTQTLHAYPSQYAQCIPELVDALRLKPAKTSFHVSASAAPSRLRPDAFPTLCLTTL